MKDYAIALILALCLSTGTFAATYYVSTTGSDSNPGTLAAPWRNPSKCGTTMSTGDTCKVKFGTYTSRIEIRQSRATFTNHSGAFACISSTGKKAFLMFGNRSSVTISNLYIKSNPQTDGNGTTFTVDLHGDQWWGNDVPTSGNNKNAVRNCFIQGQVQFLGSYNTVDSCVFSGGNGHATAIGWRFGSSHHNTASNNEIYGYTGRGIWAMSYIRDCSTYNNYVHDLKAGALYGIDWDGAGHPGYRNVSQLDRMVNTGDIGLGFENCIDCVGDRVTVDTTARYGVEFINYSTSDGNFRKSTVNTNTVLKNSIIKNTRQAGIKLAASSGNKIYHNTISNNTGEDTYWGCIGVTAVSGKYSESTVIKNNILTACEPRALWIDYPNANIPGQVYDYNIYYKPTGSNAIYVQGTAALYTLAQWVAATSPQQDVHSIQGDPDLNADLTPKSTSLSRNTGISSGGILTDFAGRTRPYEVLFDIGAYEYFPSFTQKGKTYKGFRWFLFGN